MVGINLFELQNLELRLGYSFADLGLLELALTHRSYGPKHNERLEFLGDALLGIIIARKLFEKFPESPEGDLTRMRSALVRESTLSEIAVEKGIGDCLLLGMGELKSGGSVKQSMLADAVEAIIGSIFIDSGDSMETTKRVVLSWFTARLKTIEPGEGQKDNKSVLQEYLQGIHRPLPVYSLLRTIDHGNEQIFEVSVQIEGIPNQVGKGMSKRKAEQEAAGLALGYIENRPFKRQ